MPVLGHLVGTDTDPQRSYFRLFASENCTPHLNQTHRLVRDQILSRREHLDGHGRNIREIIGGRRSSGQIELEEVFLLREVAAHQKKYDEQERNIDHGGHVDIDALRAAVVRDFHKCSMPASS